MTVYITLRIFTMSESDLSVQNWRKVLPDVSVKNLHSSSVASKKYFSGCQQTRPQSLIVFMPKRLSINSLQTNADKLLKRKIRRI